MLDTESYKDGRVQPKELHTSLLFHESSVSRLSEDLALFDTSF